MTDNLSRSKISAGESVRVCWCWTKPLVKQPDTGMVGSLQLVGLYDKLSVTDIPGFLFVLFGLINPKSTFMYLFYGTTEKCFVFVLVQTKVFDWIDLIYFLSLSSLLVKYIFRPNTVDLKSAFKLKCAAHINLLCHMRDSWFGSYILVSMGWGLQQLQGAVRHLTLHTNLLWEVKHYGYEMRVITMSAHCFFVS